MPINLGAIALSKTKQLEKRIKVLEDYIENINSEQVRDQNTRSPEEGQGPGEV